MAKATTTASTSVTPWSDPGALSTEADNALVNEVLAGFNNLATIQVASGLPFLGIDRGGDWKYGVDSVEPEPGSYWAMDLATAKWGWIAWVDSKPAGEVMLSIAQPRPGKHELDGSLPWADQVSIEMVCVSGNDLGTRVLYKTSSLGGVKAFMGYKDAAKRAIPADPTKPIAVVQLETGSYPHSKYGKIFFPVLKICGWASSGILRQGDGEDRPTGGAAAAAAAAPKEAPAAEAAKPEQPSRRRRVGA